MSGVSNIYMIDCELMDTPCSVGDTLNISLVTDGSGYDGLETVQLNVTGAGFDIAPNISMTTPFTVYNVTVEDSFSSPENEIDRCGQIL